MNETGKRIPELRVEGFIDDWEQRKLEKIFRKIRNAFVGTATPYYVENGHFYLESNNVKDGKINRNSEIFINDEFYEKQRDKWLHTNDLVMVQSGHVGHTAVIPEELDASAAHALIMFQDYKVKSNPYFLNYQFQTSDSRKKLDIITTGNTIKHILASEMKKFEVSLPIFEEQTKIGTFFKHLDDTIALHQDKQQKLGLLKKRLVKELFPQDEWNLPHIRFANFNNAWEQHQLKEVLRVNSGRDYKHLNEGDIPVYGTGGYMLSVDGKLSDVDSIGLGRKGTIDKPQYLRAPFWTVDTLFYLTPFPNYDIYFLFTLTQSINWKTMDESTGVPSLSKAVIEKVTRTFPSFEEQKKIGLFFKQLDETISHHQQKIDNMKSLKRALLNKMFI